LCDGAEVAFVMLNWRLFSTKKLILAWFCTNRGRWSLF